MNRPLERLGFTDVLNIQMRKSNTHVGLELLHSRRQDTHLEKKKKENNCNVIHAEKQYFLMYTTRCEQHVGTHARV